MLCSRKAEKEIFYNFRQMPEKLCCMHPVQLTIFSLFYAYILRSKIWSQNVIAVRGRQESLQQRRLLFTSLLSVVLIFNLTSGTIPLKTSAIMFKACHLSRKGPIYSYKIAFLIALLFIKLAITIVHFCQKSNSWRRQQQNRKKILCRIFLHSDYFTKLIR